MPKESITGKMIGKIIKKLILKRALVIGHSEEEALELAAQYGGHSLRAGYITSAYEAGADEVSIAGVSRHKHMPTMQGYFRERNLWKSSPMH